MAENLRTASLKLEFTGSYKKKECRCKYSFLGSNDIKVNTFL